MALKFYLNKFLKVDNIEQYTLSQLIELKNTYQEFIESTDGFDPDFPMSSFRDKGKKISGTNIYTIGEDTGNTMFQKETDNSSKELPPPQIKKKDNRSVEERAIDFLKNVGLA